MWELLKKKVLRNIWRNSGKNGLVNSSMNSGRVKFTSKLWYIYWFPFRRYVNRGVIGPKFHRTSFCKSLQQYVSSKFGILVNFYVICDYEYAFSKTYYFNNVIILNFNWRNFTPKKVTLVQTLQFILRKQFNIRKTNACKSNHFQVFNQFLSV